MTLHNFIVEKLVLIKGKVKREGNNITINYKGLKLTFIRTEWSAYPINEIFVKEVYSNLDVKGKNVVDIGASIADSAIYFAINGARHVYGYEPDAKRYSMALENIKTNNMEDKITIYNKIYDNYLPDNVVLKIDCEGCEYELMKEKIDFRKFGQIVLEYHNGSDKIKKRLLELNFTVQILNQSKKTGMLYAH